MRGSRHEPETPWASFSDVLSGMLFVFVITTFWFAWRLAMAERKAADELDRLQSADDEARGLIGTLDVPGRVTACLREEGGARDGARIDAVPERSDARVSLYLLDGLEWFDEGEATLGPRQEAGAARVRACVHDLLSAPALRERYTVRVYLEGHTDILPLPRGSVFPSNWELSGARAAAVLREVLSESAETGVVADLRSAQAEGALQLVAVGMADRQPAWVRICHEAREGGDRQVATPDDLAVCESLERLSASDPDAPWSEAWRQALEDAGPLYATRYADCRPRGAEDLSARRTAIDLLRAWANRCPEGWQENRKRRGLLRRVDLRLELEPRLEAREG